MSISGVAATDLIYSLKVDASDSNNVYVGEANLGASSSVPVWRIFKVVNSGGVISILFADGNQNMDNTWDNRTSLSYS